ncbi:uncharacterized protein LOC127800090 [Diospyros lotus]|uniref:uncharacterized protein LOC127800090 n=1 Tax=Diospyros lotus TaxID=55363 RepID=UPI00225AFDB3|nr:uncharacterized protein LOC127800090 [Diospyros lotus]XP_052190473.1 uncharacterized protein LOC127800090 [Diospyros lotus]
MGNEMGNNNVSGLKEEESKPGEAAGSSAGEGDRVGDRKGENQIVPAGKDKDFHEKSEGLSSEHPSDGNAQIEYNEAPSSAEDENRVDKASETNLEENVLGANDQEIGDQTSFRQEEEGARNSTGETKSALLNEEPLESAATEGNQQERGEVEAKGNMDESVVSDAEVDETATEDESVVTCTGDDEGETNAEGEVENGLSAMELTSQSGIDNTCDEEVPGLVELARNGSSKSSEETGSEIKSSISPEESYDPQDECIVLTEDKERKTHPRPQFHEGVEDEAKADEGNASKTDPGKESMADSSRNSTVEKDSQSHEMMVAENGYQKDTSNGEVKEMSRDLEEVIQMDPETGMVSTENNHAKEEEPKEKEVIDDMEEKTENMQALESGIEATHLIDYHLLASSDTSPKCPDQNQDSEIESNAVCLTDSKQGRCSQFIVNGSSVVDTNNSAEPAVFSEVGLQNGKAEEDLQRFPGKMSVTVAETEAVAHQPTEEKSVEPKASEAEESSARFSTGSVPENPSVAVELRKSPSFGFDLPHKTRSEESDQTPLLHHDKSAFGSLQYEAISVEEKTIQVERSDSDKSRAPFLNFLKEEEKAKLMAKSQKEEDDHEKKAVKESGAITKRSGKRRPRPSIFSTCICCAAAIN